MPAFRPVGEFGVFGLFGGLLIHYAFFTVSFTSIRSLCSCVRIPDAPEGFPSLSGLSVRVSALLPSELGFFEVF